MAGNRVGPSRPAPEEMPEGLTLEMALNRLAETGKLTQFTITKGEDRFQAARKRENSPAFWLSVSWTALDAVTRALGPRPGETWRGHLSLPEDYDFESEEIIAARYIYMHHPESGSVFVIEPGQSVHGLDGLCEEIDRSDYLKLKGVYEQADDFSHLI